MIFLSSQTIKHININCSKCKKVLTIYNIAKFRLGKYEKGKGICKRCLKKEIRKKYREIEEKFISLKKD